MDILIKLTSGKVIFIHRIINRIYIGIGTLKDRPDFKDMALVSSSEINEFVEAIKLMDNLK